MEKAIIIMIIYYCGGLDGTIVTFSPLPRCHMGLALSKCVVKSSSTKTRRENKKKHGTPGGSLAVGKRDPFHLMLSYFLFFFLYRYY
ncbi:hypothetical protein BDQ94DRAFT_146156 [Aspergillus welwitschiae]|uniref:Uncharacterized protein n=1 Tax=Aspergillus welwitschiae TaxID=1341132 RepID=A0A3F3Q035_9EURO|nr:hypothetical protein BDQ94DRAFT_146156 [Aspergillus welwitschiae]RDH31986.1 hypothetical protein BDQ94DRAFT_146156 [Aspergillus welwitschiae]